MSGGDPFRVLATPVPDVDEATAASVLAEHYDLDGDIRALDSERDRNFLLSADAGRYVLKFANAAEDPAVTDFQCRALVHVERSSSALPVPRVIRTLGGELHLEHRTDENISHQVRLLTYLDGVPMRPAESGTDAAAMLGTCLAALSVALAGFEHPASDHALAWDLKQAASLSDLLPLIDDAELRSLCRQRINAFRDNVEPELANLRWQVIHNDMNPGNVLVDPDDPDRITGIIDFGDMLRSPMIADVAIACAYLLRAGDDPFAEARRFVAAYSAARPLLAGEIEQLFDLILMRSAMTILISRWRAERYPDNRAYILRSEPLARTMLANASRCRRTDTTKQFMIACQPGHGNDDS